MAFDVNKPADDQKIALGPGDIRENFRALKDDKIVNAQKLQDLSPGNASGNIPIANGNLNANLNAEKLGGLTANDFAPAGYAPPAATSSSNGSMSNTDKAKLDAIAFGAEVNQNAFSNILVGSTPIQADGKTDTLEMVAGTNIALTPDSTNDRITFAVIGTVPSAAACTGNAATATKLATARNIAMTGAITGTVTFDGSANASIATTVNHNHDDRYFTETELGAIIAGSSGADKIGATGINGITGTTVQSLLESLKSYIDQRVGTMEIPAGIVAYFAMSATPAGWLKANGAAVSRITYAALFAAIGTTFGAGDGATTFNLPDLRGEFIRGYDDGRGVDSGRALGSKQTDDIKIHTHQIRGSGGGQFTDNYTPGNGAASADYTIGMFDGGIGNTGGAETRPRNVALLACIKY